jgi:hypothetical protein
VLKSRSSIGLESVDRHISVLHALQDNKAIDISVNSF